MIIIGIVGAPAGGKSTVAECLAELGATWINADKIAHEMLEKPSVKDKLVVYFGEQILAKDGKIDRSSLAELVFGDDEPHRKGLNYLESVVHPLTRQQITYQIQNAPFHQITLLDVPLLFESKWHHVCDEIWFIDAPRDKRLARAVARGWNEDELTKREQNQLPIEQKRAFSTRVISNDKSLIDLKDRLREIWDDLKQRQESTSQNSRNAKQRYEDHCRP